MCYTDILVPHAMLVYCLRPGEGSLPPSLQCCQLSSFSSPFACSYPNSGGKCILARVPIEVMTLPQSLHPSLPPAPAFSWFHSRARRLMLASSPANHCPRYIRANRCPCYSRCLVRRYGGVPQAHNWSRYGGQPTRVMLIGFWIRISWHVL